MQVPKTCLSLNFVGPVWESCGALNVYSTFGVSGKVSTLISDGGRIWAKLISVGPFLCASFLLLYWEFQSKFTQAAELWLWSRERVRLQGRMQTGRCKHQQMSHVASRVALTGPNSLLAPLLTKTRGTGWKFFNHRVAEVRDEGDISGEWWFKARISFLSTNFHHKWYEFQVLVRRFL